MISRAISVSFVSALLVGAWAGCGSDSGGTGGGSYTGNGSYQPGGGSGGPATTGSSGGSSGGVTGSSSGAPATGSSSGAAGSSSGAPSGSSSGSSSGGADASAPVEAGPPPLTLQQALTQFASCMSLTEFTTKGASGAAAADIAKAQTTQYGDCNACHNAGDGGFWASYGTVQGQDMTKMMFDQTKMFPYIAKWVTGTVDTNGNFKDLAPSNAIANQAALASQCMAGTPCHPKFALNPAVVTAINDFVTTTITAWHAGTCSQTTPVDAGHD